MFNFLVYFSLGFSLGPILAEKVWSTVFLSTLLNNLSRLFDDSHAIIESGGSHETVILLAVIQAVVLFFHHWSASLCL